MDVDINNTGETGETGETDETNVISYGSLNDFNENYDNSYTPFNIGLFDKSEVELIYKSQYGCLPPHNWSKVLIILHLKEE